MATGLNERSNTCIDIMSQNLRGFNEDKEEKSSSDAYSWD
jgi:hypothetical protein